VLFLSESSSYAEESLFETLRGADLRGPVMRILHTRVRWIRLVAATLLASVAPAAIALEAWRATQQHRRAAERALSDYAGSAAHSFRDRLISQLYVAVDRIFEPVLSTTTATTPPPDPEVMRRAADELRRCAPCGPPVDPAYYFRVTLPDSTVVLDGPPLSPRRRAELFTRMRRLDLAGLPPGWYTSFVDTLGAAPDVVYLALRPGAGVYGFVVGLEEIADTVLRPLVRQVGLVPTLTPAPGRNDSLLSITLLEPNGRRVVELSAERRPPTYSASIPASRFLGNWTLHLALDPVTAPRYLVGGLPPSRTLPLTLLALVTCALVCATMVAAWRAQELARLRTDFVASVSHELRTPLAQIQLFAESLELGRMRSRRDVRDAGRVILGESRRLLQLVENVVLVGRRGRRPALARPPSPLLLAPLIRETVESFAPVAAAADATVRMVRLDDVVAPAEPSALRQVLLNLLDNAAKYGPRGQTISVGLALAGGSARLWVEDEGPGIPSDEREMVWEPFVQLPRDLESSSAGSGIGLAIVRELVELHGGAARIETAPSGGACVVVELPNAEPQEQPCAS
jgi:signal transduction histidine kinase